MPGATRALSACNCLRRRRTAYAVASSGVFLTRLRPRHRPRCAKSSPASKPCCPFPIVVPCHRVLAAGGKLGGFSAAGGVATKQRLLEIERANVSWQLPLDA